VVIGYDNSDDMEEEGSILTQGADLEGVLEGGVRAEVQKLGEIPMINRRPEKRSTAHTEGTYTALSFTRWKLRDPEDTVSGFLIHRLVTYIVFEGLDKVDPIRGLLSDAVMVNDSEYAIYVSWTFLGIV
jgi:hypothetical protein